MTDSRFDRVAPLYDTAWLARRHVVVVGLGSGGSTVALELAKAGVGRFTLIDPDAIEVPNLIRHECDDRYLGENKAVAVADLIAHRNPSASVDAIAADVFSLGPQLTDLIASSDLVAVCTDTEPPKQLVNSVCTLVGIPAVYAGVYARAAGGEVIRCGGGPHDACYACITAVLKESAATPVDAAELDYGAIDADGTVHGAPGLGLDVRIIALIQAKMCLVTLLRADPTSDAQDEQATAIADIPADVVLFGSQEMKELFPRAYASAFVRVSPQEGCLVCGPLREGLEHGVTTAL